MHYVVLYLLFVFGRGYSSNCFLFLRINIRRYVAISEIIRTTTEYDTVVVVPMAAPVVRFSLINPVAVVIIIISDVIEIEILMPRRMPIIIILLMVKLLYTFRIGLLW